MSSKPLKAHPLADLLPPMSAAEYEALRSDIAAHGQRDPIVMLDGMVLDGRHRDRVCVDLRRQRLTRKFDPRTDGTPLAFVCSKCIHRNLDKTQKACAAARIEPELAKEAEQRMKAGGKVNGEGLARDHAARIFGISGTYVGMAKTILAADPKLFQQCFDGQETLSRAATQVRRAAKRQHLAALSSVAARRPLDGSWEIRCADAVKELRENVVKSAYHLAFADPPYNIGKDYGKGAKADRLPEGEYFEWCGEWIDLLYKALDKDGSLWLLINHENAARMEGVLKAFGFHVRAWITWYETFGVNCPNNFNRTSRRLFYCVKDRGNFIFHHEAFTRPSARQVIYGDKRASTHGKLFDDVWIIPRLVGNAAETLPDGKTQLPVSLLKPIVAGCSNPGSRVIELFTGSGSFIESAIALGRLPLGIDHDRKRVDLAIARCSAVKQEVRP